MLNGLGFRQPEPNEPNYPLTYDNRSLDDYKTVEAVKASQRYFQIDSDGIVSPITRANDQVADLLVRLKLDELTRDATNLAAATASL